MSEKQGRLIFYGAMVAEGIIALIWASAGMSFYDNAQELLNAGAGINAVVYEICQTTLGKVGSILAILGVIACPITSGDTAYRSARLTLADWTGLDQKSIKNRLLLTIPILSAGLLICQIDYSVIWRYFSWSNQTLAMITLWMASTYLAKERRNVMICVIPASFMSAMTATYFLVAPECLGLLWRKIGVGEHTYYPIATAIGLVFAVICIAVFIRQTRKYDVATTIVEDGGDESLVQN